jgi:hypothetical protein
MHITIEGKHLEVLILERCNNSIDTTTGLLLSVEHVVSLVSTFFLILKICAQLSSRTHTEYD